MRGRRGADGRARGDGECVGRGGGEVLGAVVALESGDDPMVPFRLIPDSVPGRKLIV